MAIQPSILEEDEKVELPKEANHGLAYRERKLYCELSNPRVRASAVMVITRTMLGACAYAKRHTCSSPAANISVGLISDSHRAQPAGT